MRDKNHFQMRPFVRVRIQNWQSHEDSDFAGKEQGVNLLVGTSKVGKSSIIRAFNFLLHNKVPNKDFVRHGKDNAIVTVWFPDGVAVSRIKGKRNAVEVHYSPLHEDFPLQHPHAKPSDLFDGGLRLVWDSIGHDGASYAPEVVKALGDPPFDQWHGPVSIAMQKTPDFLLSLSSTELPRAMSEMANLADLEETAKELYTVKDRAGKAAKQAAVRVSKLEDALKDYDGLDDEIAYVERLESDMSDVMSEAGRIRSMCSLADQYDELLSELSAAEKAISKAEGVAESLKDADSLSEELLRVQSMLGLADSWDQALADEEAARAALVGAEERIGRIDSEELDAITAEQSRVSSMRSLAGDYDQVMAEGKRLSSEAKAWEVEALRLEREYEAYRRDLVAQGKLCDACGQLVSA
jgi:DNA repair exonuclease SbcCD ATPase subunit